MVLEYVGVNKSFDVAGMYEKVFIGRFPGFYELVRIGYLPKNNLGLALGLQRHYCDVFFLVLAAGMAVMV